MRVRMPADIEREDRILAGLTARQLLIIAVPALGVWAVMTALEGVVPLAVRAAIAVPLLGGAVAVALARRDGLSLDRLVLAAVRFARAPKRRATAGGTGPGGGALPSWVRADTPALPAPLHLPVAAIGDDGVLDLAEHGSAVLLSCSTVNFGLRTEEEQAALVAGFASFLNSLATAPAQVLIRAEPVRLDPLVAALEQAAAALPHPGLAEAAREHAAFVTELAETRDLLSRQVLLVLREPGSSGRHAAATLHRRAEDASRALAAAGSRASVLEGPVVAAVLASAAAPTARTPPPQALAPPHALITGPELAEEVSRVQTPPQH